MDGEVTTKQDTLQDIPGQSSVEKLSPSEQEQQTFTAEEVAKRHSTLDKRISELTKEVGRSKLTFEALKTENQQLRDSLAQREKDEYDKLLEDAGGDPKLQAMLRKEQGIKAKEIELRQKEAELASREEEHKELLETASEVRRREIANKLAAEHGVSADVLLEFGDKTPEAMETTAKRLAKAMGPKKPEADGKPPMRPYSGAGSGAGGELSEEERLKQRYPTMK